MTQDRSAYAAGVQALFSHRIHKGSALDALRVGSHHCRYYYHRLENDRVRAIRCTGDGIGQLLCETCPRKR